MILNGTTQRVVIYMLNGTAAPSVLGQVVSQATDADETYIAAAAGGMLAMGIVALAGVPVGGRVPIVVQGRAQVLFATDMSPNRGKWATLDPDEAGRAGFPAAAPALGQGIGMILQTGENGTLAWVSVSFSKSEDVLGDPA